MTWSNEPGQDLCMTTLPPFWFELKHRPRPVAPNNVDDLLFRDDTKLF
jgi:hypothetical protein